MEVGEHDTEDLVLFDDGASVTETSTVWLVCPAAKVIVPAVTGEIAARGGGITRGTGVVLDGDVSATALVSVTVKVKVPSSDCEISLMDRVALSVSVMVPSPVSSRDDGSVGDQVRERQGEGLVLFNDGIVGERDVDGGRRLTGNNVQGAADAGIV